MSHQQYSDDAGQYSKPDEAHSTQPTADNYTAAPPPVGYVFIFEDWNERNGNIYYRWRLKDEKDWHERLTPYRQKPTVTYKYVSPQSLGKLKNQAEVIDLVATGSDAKNSVTNPPEGLNSRRSKNG